MEENSQNYKCSYDYMFGFIYVPLSETCIITSIIILINLYVFKYLFIYYISKIPCVQILYSAKRFI